MVALVPEDGVPPLQSLLVLQSPEMPVCQAVVLIRAILVSLGRLPLSGGKLGGLRMAERTHPEKSLSDPRFAVPDFWGGIEGRPLGRLKPGRPKVR